MNRYPPPTASAPSIGTPVPPGSGDAAGGGTHQWTVGDGDPHGPTRPPSRGTCAIHTWHT